MRRGEGLDLSIQINTLGFDEILVYLVQSGSEQTLEKLMAKNVGLDLSCLDEDDETMPDAERRGSDVEVVKGVEKVNEGVDATVGSELIGGQIVESGQVVGLEVDGSAGDVVRKVTKSEGEWSLNLKVLKGVSMLTSRP